MLDYSCLRSSTQESKRRAVLGIRAYHSIGDVPEHVDLAVVVTPAASVPSVIRECADAGVHGAVIISAGFRETGEHGVALEQQVLETARRVNMRVIGPNCLGIMCPVTGLNTRSIIIYMDRSVMLDRFYRPLAK